MLHKRSSLARALLACLLVVALPQIAPAQDGTGQVESKTTVAAPDERAPVTLDPVLQEAVRAAMAAGSSPLPAGLEMTPEFIATLVQEQEQAEDDRDEFELSLLDAIELAVRHNLTVQVSRYNQDISFEGINSSRAPFDPTVTFTVPQTFRRSTTPAQAETEGADVVTQESFNGGFTFRETLEWGTNWQVNWGGNRGVTNSQFSINNPTLTSNLAFTVTQPLLRGFGSVNRTGILVAQNSYEGSKEGFRGQLEQVLVQTYNAYWGLVLQIETLQVRQDALELAQNQLNRNRIQVEIGTLAPIETVQSERQVENAMLALIQQQNTVADQEDTLKQILNLEAVRPDALELRLAPTSELEYSTAPINTEAAIATAIDRDPQLRQNRLNLENDRLNLKQARNAQLPTVNLTAGLNLNGRAGDRVIRAQDGSILEIQQSGFTQALAQIMSGDFNTWNVGVTVQMPIHNYAADATHARASISERQRIVTLEQRRQQVVFDVRRTARSIESGVRQVETAQIATGLSERQLQAEQRKFEVGTSTNFQVLQFQDQLSQARVSEIGAVANFLVARAQFELAKGTILEFFGVSVSEAGTGRR
jgi:outer membrane protein